MKNIISKTRWNIQRIVDGYSDNDVRNLEEHLARIIRDACSTLSEEHVNTPDGISSKKWTGILSDISLGFGSYLEMREGIYTIKSKEFKELDKKFEKGLKLFTKYYTHLWD